MEKPANLVEKFVVSADGTRVFAGAIGNPSKPALVFVHGLTLSGSIFNGLFSKLEKLNDFFLVRFDLRGHGRTGKPDEEEYYSSKKHAEDYAAVVKEFGAKTPIIVCWSWGGTIPADVASYLPLGSMRGAVYLGSHPDFRATHLAHTKTTFLPAFGRWFDDSAQAFDLPIVFNRQCFIRAPDVPLNYYEETLRLHKEGFDFVPENPAATYEIRLEALGMMTSMDTKYRQFAAKHLNDDKILDLLADGFPVLEVMGTHDAFLDCEQLVESLKPIAKNLEIVLIEGGSHAPFVDAPDVVISAIMKFTKKVYSSILQ